MQNFRLSTAHVKFHQILIGSFRWKYKKFQLKKYRGVMSHVTEAWCKIWRKTGMLFQKWQEFGEFWLDHSKASKICFLTGSCLYKVYNVWLKKIQTSYLSWHWRVMQSLKKNWLIVWKMTWGIWQVFTRALSSVKIGTLMGSFCSK